MSFHFIRTFVECFRERNKSSKRNAFSYSNYTNRHKHRMPRERERKECNFPCYLKKKMSVNGKTAPTTDTRWDTLRTTGILQVEHRKKNTDNGEQTKRKKNEKKNERIHHYFQWHLPRSDFSFSSSPSFLSLCNSLIFSILIRFFRFCLGFSFNFSAIRRQSFAFPFWTLTLRFYCKMFIHGMKSVSK